MGGAKLERFLPKNQHTQRIFFEPKVEKIYMGVFSTHFVPLISILVPRHREKKNFVGGASNLQLG